MDELKVVESGSLNVIPVTEYDPFEAKFSASLYWLVFRATEDGKFENIPSQVTSPIQRDVENRITVRPEVKDFLTNGDIYCKVCNSIFHSKPPVAGQWAIIQTLSHHGFYVVEEGDIAVTDSALQQRKPFRKSTHLALMDCLMNAFSTRAVTVQQVVQSVSKISSFNTSKELPFDLEDALLLWINKLCAVLNDNHMKKQKEHAEQLLQNQDKAKRFRFRRDQLQPKVQTEFPMMEDLLKDISDGQNLLGIILFYHPTVISLEDIRFDKDLSTADCVHNLDLFRSLCSQVICTSVLSLKLEDILYGSQAMKPNVIALLAEVFHKCEIESSLNDGHTNAPGVDQCHDVACKENVEETVHVSVSISDSDNGSEMKHQNEGSERLSAAERQSSSSSDRIRQRNSHGILKSNSDTQVNPSSQLAFKSPFQLDFTMDDDLQQAPLNGAQDIIDKDKAKANPFSGIFQRPVLVADRKHGLPKMAGSSSGSPRTMSRQQEQSLLVRRNKQKQRAIDVEEWDIQQEGVEDNSILQRYLQELKVNDLQRSQSLTGLDKAKVQANRQSFHAWREDTGASLSDSNLSNLASSRSGKISLAFRPNLASGVPQRSTEGYNLMSVSLGSKDMRSEQTDSCKFLSTDSLDIKKPEDCKPSDSVISGVRDSYMSDISAKELNQFEEIEAAVLAGRSVETPRTFQKPKNLMKTTSSQEGEDELNTSVSSEDMNVFRLEVLQRLTEDKLHLPDGAELQDDDDPILQARSNAASSLGPSVQRSSLEVQDPPRDLPTDQLSPITEKAESAASYPNSVSSANSTAPSSPCSPLEVAPFTPAFFTTSPANTLDRKNQRLSLKGAKEMEVTLVGETENNFLSDPVASVTPRLVSRSGDKIREQLPRGSYTVSHASVESAKAAGIPVVGENEPVTGPLNTPPASGGLVLDQGKVVLSADVIKSEVFRNRNTSHKHVYSSEDSVIRPLTCPIAGVEADSADGRLDSLESSPAHSPSWTRGKRETALEEPALLSHEMLAQDSPSDVIIFDRQSSTYCASGKQPIRSRAKENTLKSNKTEARVFDFNQDAICHSRNGDLVKEFGTYKKSAQIGGPVSDVPQDNLRAASDVTDQILQEHQRDAYYPTYKKIPESAAREEFNQISSQIKNETEKFECVDGKNRHVPCVETPPADVDNLRQSDGFSTFRKGSSLGKNMREMAHAPHSLDLQQSDGLVTFRKGETSVGSGEFVEKESYHIDHFSASIKPSVNQGNESQHFAKNQQVGDSNTKGANDLQQASLVNDVIFRPLSSSGGEENRQRHTQPGRKELYQARLSDATNITRSRTFRKTPNGQIVKDDDADAEGSHGSRANTSCSKLSEQQTVIRRSPEGARNDQPHKITWVDVREAEAGASVSCQPNDATAETSVTATQRSPTNTIKIPRQTGRGSPGAKITWLTVATSGIGGQVKLNDKG